MLSFLPSWLRGTLSVVLMTMNTLFWFPFLLVAALLKLFSPATFIRRFFTRVLIYIANAWVSFNSAIQKLINRIRWDIRGLSSLNPKDWYFVTCNHQSWADILVIQHVLNGKIPMLKFFLKKELIWVPIMGICWWALDFPFMKRYTKAFLEKHPELAGKDLETTRKACEKFKYTPVTVFNFIEGTRFTEQKHQRQQSPFKHLLKPKAGGAAFVLGAMGEQLHTMLDITIVYPQRAPSFWEYLCGKAHCIVVDIKTIKLPESFLGRNYETDEAFKKDFQQWITQLWYEKDHRLHILKQS
ncbi:MAG: acyltransferase [Hahellaceae bacterium]|nr:acyltransferase [Hahellaceae bacterium]MCP5169060.1 acyltransferase [Hahellaceae bacterium]